MTKKEIELPMDSFVRGGTTSSGHDRLMFEQHADAEQRRAQQDAQYHGARAGKVPGFMQDESFNPGAAPGHGKLTSLNLGGGQHAAIVLGYKHPKDNLILDWVTCELWEQPWDDPSRPGAEVFFTMVCLKCIWKRQVKMESAQITMRQTNRRFELDVRKAGTVWINPKDPNEVVTLAGEISMGGEWGTCPQCDWRFTIDQSIIYDDGRAL